MRYFRFLCAAGLVLLTLSYPRAVAAFQPVVESRQLDGSLEQPAPELYGTAQPLGDPVRAAVAVYGDLRQSGEVDLYSFVASQDLTLPLELVVPAKTQYGTFKPTVAVIGPNLPLTDDEPSPLPIPLGYDQLIVASPPGRRTPYFDLGGLQYLFTGTTAMIPLTANLPYFLAVYDPREGTGGYRIKIGTTTNRKTSYQSYSVDVDSETLTFADTPVRPTDETPPARQPEFTDESNPFQLFDNQVKLFGDYLGYLLYRIMTLI